MAWCVGYFADHLVIIPLTSPNHFKLIQALANGCMMIKSILECSNE